MAVQFYGEARLIRTGVVCPLLVARVLTGDERRAERPIPYEKVRQTLKKAGRL